MSSLTDDAGLLKPASVFAAVSRRRAWLPLLLVWAAALLARHVVAGNTDVSWLLTLAERVLDGQRPYVDFIELNPPASIYLYVPGVALARAIGMSPEVVTDGLIFILIGASLWLAGRILANAGVLERSEGGWLTALASIVLALLPAMTFGEREHVGVALMLPMLAVLTVRACAKSPDRHALIAAGIGAGLTVVIKPHLVLGLAAAIAAAACAARSWRVLFAAENRVAAAVIALYGAVVMVEFPHFISDIVPLAGATYVPVRLPLATMLGLSAFPIWALSCAIVLYVRHGSGIDARHGVLLAGSFGFALTYLVQGKGWPYHSYPMLALALLAVAVAVVELVPETSHRRRNAGVAFGFICLIVFGWLNLTASASMSPLVAPIRQAKPHPTMLSIATDIAVGYPLARDVGATWVGSLPNLWITRGVLWRRAHETLGAETAARLDRDLAFERSLLLGDFRRAKPDIVLVEEARFDEIRSDPEFAEVLRPYGRLTTMNDILVLRHDEAQHDAVRRTSR